jgi:hypothetical protein
LHSSVNEKSVTLRIKSVGSAAVYGRLSVLPECKSHDFRPEVPVVTIESYFDALAMTII